jgi:hypothetical protein
MPVWIDFGWNKALVDVPGVYLKDEFTDLEQQFSACLEDPPEISQERTEDFV